MAIRRHTGSDSRRRRKLDYDADDGLVVSERPYSGVSFRQPLMLIVNVAVISSGFVFFGR